MVLEAMINSRSSKELVAENSYDFWELFTEGKVFDLDLFTACSVGKFEYIQQLLRNDSRTDIVNIKNEGGWSPLMYVCYIGNYEITELLVREGADVLFEEKEYGRTPLMLASSSGNIYLVKFLIKNRAQINQRDRHGQTALYHAAEHGQTKIVEYLLSISADVLIRQNGTGYTPFMEAAKQGHEAVFNAFLDHDVDLRVVSSQGYTARDLAEQCNSHVIVKMIDNHQIKSRYKTDLSCIGNTKQPHQKVNQWLNDHNPDHFYDDILTNKLDVCEDINSRTEMPSCGIPICSPYKHYSVEESLGKSYGDSTIVDSDRTPLGTPVDSMFQQYMSADIFLHRSSYNHPTLQTFLKDLGLEKYFKTFKDAHIDFDLLLSSTEEDFKELGIVLGPRRKLKMAIDQWKEDKGWTKEKKYTTCLEVNDVKVQLADVYSKLEHINAELVHEKEARASLEAELMEGRARKNHMYFIGEKVIRACKDMLNVARDMKRHIDELKSVAADCKEDEVKSKLNELFKHMSENVVNTNYTTETISRRVEKLLSDGISEQSSNSDSPESSCTSFSKSESGSGNVE